MTTLTKTTSYTYTPGTPGRPGYSGTPATPGYWTTKRVETGRWVLASSISKGSASTLDGSTSSKYVYVTEIVDERVYVPASAGSPAIAGVPSTPTVINTTLNLGWTASAMSTGSFAANGHFAITSPTTNLGVVAGISSSAPADYRLMEFGFYVSHGYFRVIELGVFKTESQTFGPTDKLTIQRSGNSVQYLVNTTIVYKSAAPSSGTATAYTWLYSGGDLISSAEIADTLIVSVGTGRIVLSPIRGHGRDVTANEGVVELSPVKCAATGRRFAGANLKLRPVSGFGANGPYSFAKNTLEPAKVFIAASEIVPSYALSIIPFLPVAGVGIGTTGTIGHATLKLRPVQALGSDHPYGQAINELSPIQLYGAVFTVPNAVADLRFAGKYSTVARGTKQPANSFSYTYRYSLNGYGGGGARLVGARSILASSGTVSAVARATLSSPKLAMLGFSGGVATPVSPSAQMLATGTGVIIGRAYLLSPAASLNSTGVVGGVAKAALTAATPFAVEAYTGGWIKLSHGGRYQLTVSMVRGGLGRVSGALPRSTLVSSGHADIVGRARLVSPMLRMVQPGIARLSLSTHYLLRATASLFLPTVYEAYSITLSHDIDVPPQSNEVQVDAITHYTNYPFNQIVRLRDKYYGVADNGLYLLGGDTDIAAPIPWSFETVLSDFDSPNLKRLNSMTLGGRVQNGLQVQLNAGEKETDQYVYTTPRGVAVQNYRQRFGKGVRTRYASVTVSDTQGDFIEIDSLAFDVETLSRTI